MIALAIFGLSILTAVMLMSFSLRTVQAERQLAYVARVLETTMENLRHLSWAELTAQPVSQTFDASKPVVPLFGKAINDMSTADDDFTGKYFNPTGTIRVDTVFGQPDLRKISVEVSYKSAFSSKPISSNLVTLISRNGIDRR